MARLTSTARWPAQECLHEKTAGPTRIERWPNHLVRLVPERCIDCRSRRDPETGEWIAPEGEQSQ